MKGQDKRMATTGGGGAAAAPAAAAAGPTLETIVRDMETVSRGIAATLQRKDRELAEQRGETQTGLVRVLEQRKLREQAVICNVLVLACGVTVRSQHPFLQEEQVRHLEREKQTKFAIVEHEANNLMQCYQQATNIQHEMNVALSDMIEYCESQVRIKVYTSGQLQKAQADVHDMQTKLEKANERLEEAQKEAQVLTAQLQTHNKEVNLLLHYPCITRHPGYIMHTTLDGAHNTNR